jgi:hypothetical protein
VNSQGTAPTKSRSGFDGRSSSEHLWTDTCVQIATFLQQVSAKQRHVGMMWNMYLSEQRNGTGLADMVILAYTAGDEYVTQPSGRSFNYLCLTQRLRFH